MYDKPENAQLSRRERILLDPLGASQKSDAEKQIEYRPGHYYPKGTFDKKNKEGANNEKEGSFYGYNEKSRNYEHGLDD